MNKFHLKGSITRVKSIILFYNNYFVLLYLWGIKIKGKIYKHLQKKKMAMCHFQLIKYKFGGKAFVISSNISNIFRNLASKTKYI
jgi:hypothetical protein